jgi:hypothetical protein
MSKLRPAQHDGFKISATIATLHMMQTELAVKPTVKHDGLRNAKCASIPCNKPITQRGCALLQRRRAAMAASEDSDASFR